MRECLIEDKIVECDEYRWTEYDARGIPLCQVCDNCVSIKLSKYRPDVLIDPNYWHDEPIEEDEV